MKKYTVIGMYDSEDESFVEWVTAINPDEAARKALKKQPDASFVSEVFEGHHKGLVMALFWRSIWRRSRLKGLQRKC